MHRFSNNYVATLLAAISPSDTTIRVSTVQNLPTISGGQFFKLTLESVDGLLLEIVKVTAVAGDALTVERAQEGTPALPFQVDAGVTLRLTAEALNEFSAGDHTHELVDVTDSGAMAAEDDAPFDGVGYFRQNRTWQRAPTGVIEYSATATDDAGDGTAAGDINLTDFTGHPYADSLVTTALFIEETHSVTFVHKTVAYKWVGPKNVTVGVGGGYSVTADDLAGIGTADHAQLINLSLPDQHPIAATTGLQAALDAKADQTALDTHIADPDNPHAKMNWRGNWSSVQYEQHDVVVDGDWLMIANKATTDRAAPQPAGDAAWMLPEAPAWTVQNFTGVVHSGVDIEFTLSGYVKGIRIWAPELTGTTNYRIILFDVTDPDNPIYRQIEEPILNEGAWTIVSLGSSLVNIGAKFRIYVDALNSADSTTVTGGWTYTGTDNIANPPAQSWNTNNAESLLRVSNTDLDTTDRTTELMGVGVGSRIRFAETAAPEHYREYVCTGDPTDTGTVITWPVVLDDTGGDGLDINPLTTTMTATVYTPQSTQYAEIVDQWLTDPPFATVDGYLALDGVEQAVPNNAYGLDVQFQEYTLSPDWDFMSSGASASSGSGGDGLGDAPADGSMYARKDSLWANIAIADVQTLQTELDGKSPTTHNHDGDYDPAGAAAAVQTNLDGHTGNSSNPHSVTNAQVNAPAVSGDSDIGASLMKLSVMTQAEYDGITPDANTIYFING